MDSILIPFVKQTAVKCKSKTNFPSYIFSKIYFELSLKSDEMNRTYLPTFYFYNFDIAP